MKKEDVNGLIMYMLIIAGAVVFGLTVLQPYFAKSTFNNGLIYALFILGAIAAGILTFAFLLEVGHILGAKIGGYEILSVNILHILFIKEEGKMKVKSSPFDGLTGETKILPKDEKSNPRPYLLLGTFFTSLILVGCIIVFYVNMEYVRTNRSDLAYFFLTMGVTIGIAIVYNIVPFKLDSLNDGYRLAMMSNPKNKEAFNELLRVEYEVSQGNTDVEIKTFTELTNFSAELNMNKVYVLLDKKNFEEADKLLDIMLENKDNISRRLYIRAMAMKVFIVFMNNDLETAIEKASNDVSMELRRDIIDEGSLISIRAYVLVSGLVDNSKSECIYVLDNVYRAYKRTPKNRRLVELNLFNDALDLVANTHPKWDIAKYKIVDDTLEVPEDK